jgi:hypothetical protein
MIERKLLPVVSGKDVVSATMCFLWRGTFVACFDAVCYCSVIKSSIKVSVMLEYL